MYITVSFKRRDRMYLIQIHRGLNQDGSVPFLIDFNLRQTHFIKIRTRNEKQPQINHSTIPVKNNTE